jgi:hypothetical protein
MDLFGKSEMRRQIKRLREREVEWQTERDALVAQIKEKEKGLSLARSEIDVLEMKLSVLHRDKTNETVMRISAQRGLVRLYREVGQGDQIGYDPDRDESLIEIRAAMAHAASTRIAVEEVTMPVDAARGRGAPRYGQTPSKGRSLNCTDGKHEGCKFAELCCCTCHPEVDLSKVNVPIPTGLTGLGPMAR